MQVVDANGNVFGQGLEITGIDGKPKVPVINTDITIGTTAIIGGVDGRILFQGTGGVVQESGNLAWDITNSRITINTTTGGPAAIFKNATNGLTITPTSTKVNVYSDYFGAGTDKMLILSTYANQANQLSLFTTGNIGVNTATDSGFKFDVAGTIRSTGVITGYQFNSSYNGGSYSSIGVNVLDYGDGLRIGYSGSVQKITLFTAAGTPRISVINNGCVGFTNSAPTANIHTSLSITAASAIGRGVYFNNTLVASANNDVLVGLDIEPTYTNGAFTGLTNVDLRTKGARVVIGAGAGYGAVYGYNNDGLFQFSTSGTNSVITLRPNNTAANYNSSYWSYIIQENYSFKIIPGNYQSLYLRNYSVSGAVYVGGRENANSYGIYIPSNTANVLVNTTTDSGFKFDVNGTARINNIFYVTNPSYTGNIRIEAIANTQQRIVGANGENITWGPDNAIRINSGETYVSGSFLGSGWWMQSNGATVLGAQAAAAASALLDIRSTTRGFLPPRMTNAQMLAISTPATGLMVYDTTNNKLCCYDGTTWQNLF